MLLLSQKILPLQIRPDTHRTIFYCRWNRVLICVTTRCSHHFRVNYQSCFLLLLRYYWLFTSIGGWRNLTRRSGLAEGHTKRDCFLPLDLTSGSGSANVLCLTTLLLTVETDPHLQRKGHTLLLEPPPPPTALGEADVAVLVTVAEWGADPNEQCRWSESLSQFLGVELVTIMIAMKLYSLSHWLSLNHGISLFFNSLSSSNNDKRRSQLSSFVSKVPECSQLSRDCELL